MNVLIIVFIILILLEGGVIAFLIWREKKRNPSLEKIDEFVKRVDDLICARLDELEEKIHREYKTAADIDSALNDLGFKPED